MTWILAILIVLALGGVAVVAAGKGTPMAEAYDDRPDALVPADGPLVGADLRRVRFSLAVRGYRMSEVDALLDRLAAQLEAAEERSSGVRAAHEAERDRAAPGSVADADIRADVRADARADAGPPPSDEGDVTGEGRGGRLDG